MKFVLMVILFFTVGSIKEKDVEPYSKTGHDQFSELILTNGGNLMIDYPDVFIEASLNELKRKAFGTTDKRLLTYADASYVSTTIFSRSNKTREAYTFTYDLSTVVYSEVSVAVKGSLSAKGVYKAKKGEITGNGELSITYTTDDYIKTTENGKMSIVIYPNKKVSFRIVGEAKVTNGIRKSYFLGITTKKGCYEVVDIVSTCFELKEEDA